MKYLIINLLSICFFIGNLTGQTKIHPSKTHSLVVLNINHPDKSPYNNGIVFFTGKKGTKLSAKTNETGQLEILLPINDQYTTQCGSLVNEKLIIIKNRANVILRGRRYTHKFIDYTFKYKNYEDDPVVDEIITIISNTGETYQESTGSNGEAKFYLPHSNTYSINAKYNPDITTINIPEQGQTHTRTMFTFRGIGSVAQDIYDEEEAEYQLEIEEKRRIEDSIRGTQPTTIIFFASEPNHTSVGNITVYDGGKDGEVIGEVTAVWNCHRGPTKEEDIQAKIVKMKGSFRYYAKSSKGMEWEGTYEVLGGGTQLIPLDIKIK
jgi:hypothetical protein